VIVSDAIPIAKQHCTFRVPKGYLRFTVPFSLCTLLRQIIAFQIGVSAVYHAIQPPTWTWDGHSYYYHTKAADVPLLHSASFKSFGVKPALGLFVLNHGSILRQQSQ